MKTWIRPVCSFLLAAAIGLCPVSLSAEMLDPDRDSTLTLIFNQDRDIPDGGSVEYIQAADIDLSEPASPVFVYTEAFKGEKMPLVDFENPRTAAELNTYATNRQIQGQTVDIRNGKAVFGSLPQGLYLIRQKAAIPGFNDMAPFLISVPLKDEGSDAYIYTVEARPKLDLAERNEPNKPNDFTEDSEDNSQTGWFIQTSEQTTYEYNRQEYYTSISSSITFPVKPDTSSSKANTGVVEHSWMYAAAGIAAVLTLIILIRKKRSDQESE